MPNPAEDPNQSDAPNSQPEDLAGQGNTSRRAVERAGTPFHFSISLPDDQAHARDLADAELEVHTHARQKTAFSEGPWVLILGFALIIAAGTLVLKLPWAAAPNTSIGWGDALFTATSATTVTGLVVLNTALDFSIFGQVVILVLLQVGGVGFISFSVLLFRLIGRRLTLQNRFIVQQSLGTDEASGVLNLALYVLGVTLTIEALGALLLWLRWRQTLSGGQALWYALFHAISSYCNAGFDLFSGTSQGVLFGYGTDWYTLLVMGLLILLGGIGIAIMYDVWSYRDDRNLSINTRITILLGIALTVVGVAAMFSDMRLHGTVMAENSMAERFAVSLFTMISSRTAGLTILPLDSLGETTQMIILLWMFIGGSPASMAGGITTSTVGVLLISVVATVRGLDAAAAFGRTIPFETVAKAVAIVTVSTLLVALVTLVIVVRHEGEIFTVAFEVVSAFANAGYSLDFTADLGRFDRLLVALTMFWGRLGPLTVVVALAQRRQPTLVRYPEEPIILG